MGEILIERRERTALVDGAQRQITWDQVTLALGKGNAVGPEFLEKLDAALGQLESTEPGGAACPIVLTGQGSVFSAGLDLPTLVEFDRGALARFLEAFDRVFLRFALLCRPVVAAVNGHAVAGGAILLLACDRRIGASAVPGSGKPYRIGLRESALGLGLPRAAWGIVENALGTGWKTREILYSGALYEPAGALEMGYLDAVVTPESLMSTGEDIAVRYAATTARAAADLKRSCTTRLAHAVQSPLDSAPFLDAWFSPEAQERLRDVVASLRR